MFLVLKSVFSVIQFREHLRAICVAKHCAALSIPSQDFEAVTAILDT